ncbi:MAG: response regulator [bacterium]
MINTRKKILVVDDDLTSRRLMEKVIRSKWNCNVFQAEDGSEALKVMLREKPNLVVLDLVMPFMNGIQVLQTMRKSVRLAKINVLACTAVGDNKVVKEILRLGVSDYIVKPVTKHLLIEKICRILDCTN